MAARCRDRPAPTRGRQQRARRADISTSWLFLVSDHSRAALQHELKAKHRVPECALRKLFRQDGIPVALDILADAIQLYLDESVQRPVHSKRQNPLALGQNELRARTPIGFAAAQAVEPQALEPGYQLDSTSAALQEVVGRLHRPLLVFAGYDPGARHIPGTRAGVLEIVVREPLLEPRIQYERVLGACGAGAERPIRVTLPAVPAPLHINRLDESVLRQ